jgi:hypothetical protein
MINKLSELFNQIILTDFSLTSKTDYRLQARTRLAPRAKRRKRNAAFSLGRLAPQGVQPPPSQRDLLIAPVGGKVGAVPQKQVDMIRHHTEAEQIDGEDASEIFQTRQCRFVL